MGYLLTIIARLFETAIRSAGAHLCFSVSGIFFLALPVTFGASAYTMVIAGKAGIPLPLALILSLVVTLTLAGFFALAYMRMSNDSYAVLTLTSLVAMEALVKSWDSVTGGVLGITGITRPSLIAHMPVLILGEGIIVAMVIAAEYLILHSAFGRHLRALKENKPTLSGLGISFKRTGAIVVILASLLAAVEGILAIWRIQYLDPSFFGVHVLLSALTVAILAYRPKVLHMVLAVIFVILMPEALRFLHISSVLLGHMRIVLYSLLIIVMIRFLSGRNISSDRSF